MKTFHLLFILLLLSINGVSQIRSKKVFIDIGARLKVPCVIWTPGNWDSTKMYPWVVALHGAGELGDGSDPQLTSKIVNNTNFSNLLLRADKLGFLVIQPQLVQELNGWSPGFKPVYINYAINYAMANYKLDPNRMYMTGLSMGGGACWEYVTSSADNASRVAALIPICGTWITGNWSLIGATNMPVWAFHAADDGTVSVNATRTAIAAIKATGAKPEPKYTEFATGGHGIWSRAYNTDELYTWMLAQTNNGVIVDPVPPAFKPTHKIIRKDGSVEEVRIEAIP